MADQERLHPRDVVAAACERWGVPEVASRCAALLDGSDDVRADIRLVRSLGMAEAHREKWLLRPANGYWLRVWGARGLLYAWDPTAEAPVVNGLADEHWRVREMSAKVALLRELGASAEAACALVTDDVPRVRVAAVRLLAEVGEAEHAGAIRAALDDPEARARAAASRALDQLATRRDRPI